MTSTKGRAEAREYAYKFIYQFLLAEGRSLRALWEDGERLDLMMREFEESYNEPDEEHPNNLTVSMDRPLAKTLVAGTLEQMPRLEQRISEYLQGRSLETLDRTVLAGLLLGAFELERVRETPPKVSIDQVVGLVRKYGSEQGHGYVNAVLDKFHHSLAGDKR